ncbi:MAG: hypothetical protein ACE5J7_04010, partial [Candidatus Aenigmatarchaeota archaeon]
NPLDNSYYEHIPIDKCFEIGKRFMYYILDFRFRKEVEKATKAMRKFELKEIDLRLTCADVRMDDNGIFHYRNFTSGRDGKQFYASEEKIPSKEYSSIQDMVKIMEYNEQMIDGLGGGPGSCYLSEKDLVVRAFERPKKAIKREIKEKIGKEVDEVFE